MSSAGDSTGRAALIELAHLLEASWLGTLLRSRGWVWPVLEICHLIGLALLFGVLIIVDLKILGFAPDLPFTAAERLIPVALIGFAINVVTGALLVMGDAHYFLLNSVFWAKIGAIGLAGLNAALFTLLVHRKAAAGVQSFGRGAKLSAVLSLALWASIAALARFIAYVEHVA